MAKDSRATGIAIEQSVKRYLQKQALDFVEANFHSRFGEIDLIFLDKNVEPHCLVFVEVRYRADNSFGSAAESVDYRKQQKLLKTAEVYLQQKKMTNFNARFDVVSANATKDHKFQWYKNAFEASPW
ncbi:YraN family protein [Kangiella sp. TOML190]|uniref:YraN family protein n=1 Tax=Kangiella sp. TOML190 TaxID=2931351 RepID=UPI00203EED12|nr:YraN family protein [Kangiella sp. TOML190]